MWKVILLTIVVGVKSEELKEGWGIVGNPLLHARPCKGNDKMTVSFEPGLPPGSENQYILFIMEEVPAHTRVYIKFDSEAVVSLIDPSTARISALDGMFHIRYFKKDQSISLKVQGPATGTIPYVTSAVINTVEYCKNPNSGYLDQYIQGNQDTAEVHLPVPTGKCGRRKVQHTALITNGLSTKSGDWPWHAAIYRLESGSVIKYICGGTVISKSFILTAAHCTSIRGERVLPEILSVVLGKYNLIGGDVASQEKQIHQVIVHEEFSYKHLDNDIALLKLKTEVVFDDYVQPACMWHPDVIKRIPSGTVFGTVVGWGFDQSDTLSNQLKQATIPKISDAQCIKSNPVFFGTLLNSRKFCAGWNNGTSACNGDSGGAFQVFVPDTAGDTSPNAPGTWYVRGIVSLSVARQDAAVCDPSQYVLFTDVAKYRGWLKQFVKNL